MRRFICSIKSAYIKRAAGIERDGIFHYLKNDAGYVLIIVMIVCSLLITVSGEFMVNTQADISYMKRFKDEPQAKELAEIGVKIATYILYLDSTGHAGSLVPGRKSQSNVDSMNDLWAAQFPPIVIDDGSVFLTIRDEQSKINLNLVANEYSGEDETYFYKVVQRFFQNLDLPKDIPDCIRDWIDPNNNRSGYGAETEDYYATLPLPYSAKNAPMDSISELMMIKNITPEIFLGLGGGNTGKEHDIVESNLIVKPLSKDDFSTDKETDKDKSKKDEPEVPADTRIGPEKSRALADYFTVYGDKQYDSDLNKININTASYRVISALTQDMTADKVSEIIRKRNSKPYSSVDDLSAIITEKTYRDRLSVSSQIYSIQSTGVFRGQKVNILAVYNRAQKKFYYYSVR
jgi:type II secretory pathway component PulK